MHDLVGLLFASVNVCLSVLILGIVTYGVSYFKDGVLVKTLRRARLVAVLLFLLFLTEALIAVGILPSNTPINDILGTVFLVSFIYLAYGFTNDWKTL